LTFFTAVLIAEDTDDPVTPVALPMSVTDDPFRKSLINSVLIRIKI